MAPAFSTRLAWNRPENSLAALERARRARDAETHGPRRGDASDAPVSLNAPHAPILDLTESNPTRVGLPDLGPRLRQALAETTSGVYAPVAAGLDTARAAISRALAAAGTPARADHLVLTASSSESYAWLFKVLCDPGDAVLVPEPSYPLFEYLASLEGVRPVPYRLAYDGAWHVDFASVDDALARAGGRARALVVVNPNNPTGSFLKRFELAPLAARAEAHGLAVIADEVFALYGAAETPGDRDGDQAHARVCALAAEPALTDRVLTFALGGLSKACGLPQLKLGWTLTEGPVALAEAARARLELVADTYLSVGGPVQEAAARLLALGDDARRAISARIAANHAHLARALSASSPCTLLAREGGWGAILRVPATRTDEEWALALLAEDGVLVHPGYFFDLRGGTFLVLSLLPPPELFGEAIRRLLARCGG